MSIEALRWAWTQQVKASHKLVLMAIADGADSFGEAWLSQGVLAYQTELLTRSVITANAALVEVGLIQRLRGSRKNRQRGVDQIVLSLEKGAGKAPWKGLGEVRRQLAECVERDGVRAGQDFGPDLVSTQDGEAKGIDAGQSQVKNLQIGDSTCKSFTWSDENSSPSDPADTCLLLASTFLIHHHHPSAPKRLWMTTMTTRQRLRIRFRAPG